MKIVRVEAVPIQAQPTDTKPYWGSRAWGSERHGPGELSTEYPPPLRRRFVYSKTIDTVVVRIETDTGHVGWGEAKAPVAPQVTAKIIELLLTDIVLGTDPRETTVLWERMYAGMRVRGHRAGFWLEAISGVDIALWDLAGQAAGAPISTLLGGRMRDAVRVYASGLPALPLDAPDEALAELVDEARALREAGYPGVKIAIGRGVRGDLRTICAIRDALGEDFAIYADAAGVYARADAMRLGHELEALGVGFFEMPIPPEDVEGYAELARALSIPIALDSIMSRHEVVELIRAGAIDIVQPDVSSRRRHHRMPPHRRTRRRLRTRLPAACQHRLGDPCRRQRASRGRDAEQPGLRILDRPQPHRKRRDRTADHARQRIPRRAAGTRPRNRHPRKGIAQASRMTRAGGLVGPRHPSVCRHRRNACLAFPLVAFGSHCSPRSFWHPRFTRPRMQRRLLRSMDSHGKTPSPAQRSTRRAGTFAGTQS